MALSVPDYPIPYSTEPATAAYVWIQALSINFVNGSGNVSVGVNLDVDSANAGLAVIDSFSVNLGRSMGLDGGGQPILFPDLTTIVTNAAVFAGSNPGTTPFDAIRSAIYEALLAHPKLAGATPV